MGAVVQREGRVGGGRGWGRRLPLPLLRYLLVEARRRVAELLNLRRERGLSRAAARHELRPLAEGFDRVDAVVARALEERVHSGGGQRDQPNQQSKQLRGRSIAMVGVKAERTGRPTAQTDRPTHPNKHAWTGGSVSKPSTRGPADRPSHPHPKQPLDRDPRPEAPTDLEVAEHDLGARAQHDGRDARRVVRALLHDDHAAAADLLDLPRERRRTRR